MAGRKSNTQNRSKHGRAGEPKEPASSLVVGAICVLLLAVTWLVFGHTLRYGFVNYDDDRYIYANPQIARGLTTDGIGWAFAHVHAANWHPLTTISHLLDYQLYGLEAWGHHLSSVLLHGVAVVLLFGALTSLTGKIWQSAFVAAIFAVHPLRVESVAWISERKDVLSGVFFMLVLWAYARYARPGRESIGSYLMVLVWFGLGLMCKPSLVTVPFVLLLLDYWPLSRWPMSDVRLQKSVAGSQWSMVRSLVLEKIPLVLLSAGSCAITLLVQTEAFPEMEAVPFSERLANAMVSYLHYVGQMVYPACLAVLYPYPLHGIGSAVALGSILFLSAVSAACFVLRRRYPFLLTGWFWFVGMLVPMIGLVQVGSQAWADRYTYLPMIGFCIGVTWMAMELFARWRVPRPLIATFASIIIVALGTQAWLQTNYWRNGKTLWTHTIECTSDNYIAYNNLANWFLLNGELDQAIDQATIALTIQPGLAEAEGTLGNSFVRKGDLDSAFVHYRAALEIKPGFAEIESNLGNILLARGQVDEAVEHYRKALETNPGAAGFHNNLGNALFQKGQIDEAVAQYRAALEIDSRLSEAHTNLGTALLDKKDFDGAVSELQAALTQRPAYPEAEYNLGRAYVGAGNSQQAIIHFTQALRLKPDYEEAKQQLRELNASSSQ